jgi:hypothetical protein
MSQSQWNDFTLPNGRTVKVSNEESDWPKVGETGFVPYEAVLPDPNQPRDTTDYTNTEEHALLSASTSRRAQGLIMRVRPFSEQDIEDHKQSHPCARYWIVDGERRYHACGPKGANLGILEINVHPYNVTEDIFLDQVVLNTLQMKLSTPELVRALAKIRTDHNVNSANALATMVNMPQVKVAKLWHMINLVPEILARTNEQKFKGHERGDRLAIGPASELAQIRASDEKTAHERQLEIFKEATQKGIRGAKQQIAFFTQFQEQERKENRQKRRPKRQRNRIRTLVEIVVANDLLRASNAELDLILSSATRDELLDLSRSIGEASTLLRTFSGRVKDRIAAQLEEKSVATTKTLSSTTPKATPADPFSQTQRLLAMRAKSTIKPPATNSITSTNLVVKKREEPVPPSSLRHHVEVHPSGRKTDNRLAPSPITAKELQALVPRPIIKEPQAIAENGQFADLRELFRHGVVTSVWATQSSRYCTEVIDRPNRYLTICDERRFKYQKEKAPRPSNYPDPEEVRKMIEARIHV